MTDFYNERTNRNIGWITGEEQVVLRSSTVGIAGCGGMGGLLAATLLRTGIGEIRIADNETFDISNLNRQLGATRGTLGMFKAETTALLLQEIANDVRICVFSEGITTTSVESFVSGCDVVCDEIEFWAIGARCILHEEAERKNTPIQTCTSVGFGARLVRFDHCGIRMRDMLGVSLEEACLIESRIAGGVASTQEVERVLQATLAAIAPRLPRYTILSEPYNDRCACLARLRNAQCASIIGSNPPFATGFAANQVILGLLQKSGLRRIATPPPPTPGYLYVDAAFMSAHAVARVDMTDE